jgi:hypothetical protein
MNCGFKEAAQSLMKSESARSSSVATKGLRLDGIAAQKVWRQNE